MKISYKYLITISAFLAVLASCSYTQKITDKFFPNGEFNTQVVKADAAMESGDFGKAIAAYEEAAKLHPTDWDVKLKQAKAYERDGNLAQAFNIYQIIIDSANGKDSSAKAIDIAKANQIKLGFSKEPVIADVKPASAINLDTKAAVAETLAEVKRPLIADPSKPADPAPASAVIANKAPIAAAPKAALLEKPVVAAPPPPAIEKAAPVTVPAAEKAPIASEKSLTSNNPDEAAILAAVEGWRAAWIAQNLDSYIEHYSKNFKGDTKNRKAWIAQRKAKITHGKSIKLELTNFNVKKVNKDTFDVEFSQHYQSASYKDNGIKTLRLEREKNRWIIINESFKS